MNIFWLNCCLLDCLYLNENSNSLICVRFNTNSWNHATFTHFTRLTILVDKYYWMNNSSFLNFRKIKKHHLHHYFAILVMSCTMGIKVCIIAMKVHTFYEKSDHIKGAWVFFSWNFIKNLNFDCVMIRSNDQVGILGHTTIVTVQCCFGRWHK